MHEVSQTILCGICLSPLQLRTRCDKIQNMSVCYDVLTCSSCSYDYSIEKDVDKGSRLEYICKYCYSPLILHNRVGTVCSNRTCMGYHILGKQEGHPVLWWDDVCVAYYMKKKQRIVVSLPTSSYEFRKFIIHTILHQLLGI